MNKEKGMYSYIKPNTNIKTKYIIEYTRDQKIFEMMDKSSFTFDMLDKKEFNYLDNAIDMYNVLYYDPTVLHIMLHEEIILDEEIILEQSKDGVMTNILDRHTQNEIKKVKTQNEELQDYLQIIETALLKYNMTIKQLLI